MNKIVVNFIFYFRLVVLCVLTFLGEIKKSNSQSKISIKIIGSKSKEPVPFANLQELPHGTGFSADSLGIIKLGKTVGLFYLTAIGYKDTIIRGDTFKDSAIFSMTSIDYSLNEVVVYPLKMKQVSVGMPRLKSDCGQHILNINQGIVTFIPNKKKYRGYIETISIKLYSKSRWDCPFKLKIMKVDSTFQTVGIPLHKKEIVVKPSKGGWVDVDISNEKLAIPEDGILVSISTFKTGDCFYYVPKIKMGGYGVGVNVYKKDDESLSWGYNPETNKFGIKQNKWNYAMRVKLRVF